MTNQALVLGASSGIGAEVALFLANLNWKVVGCGSREISSWKYKNDFECTVLDIRDVDRFMKFIEARFSKTTFPSLVINTVGQSDSTLLMQMTQTKIREVIETNYIAPIAAQNEILKKASFLRKEVTSIFLNSMSTKVHSVGNSVYASAKSALARSSKSFAVEYHRHGHVFYDISLSLVKDSTMVKSLTESSRKNYESRLYFPNIDQEELNQFILFLATKRPKSLSGTQIEFGGLT